MLKNREKLDTYYKVNERVTMAKNVCEEIRLVDNVLQAEDFIRLRIQTGFVEIPVEHAQKALQKQFNQCFCNI